MPGKPYLEVNRMADAGILVTFCQGLIHQNRIPRQRDALLKFN